MTHCDPFLVRSQNWTFALRLAMGYPRYAPAFHTTAWSSSGRQDIFQAMQVTQLAIDMGCDMVHVSMTTDGGQPLGVSLAIRQGAGVELMPNLRLYAASETSKIELLSDSRRWFVGSRHVLTSAKLPPKSRREQGEKIARRRWRQMYAALGDLRLEGNLSVPVGGRYADAIRHEDIKIAA